MYQLPVGEIMFLLRQELYTALDSSKGDARIGKTVPGLVAAMTVIICDEHLDVDREDLQGELGYQVAKVWDALREGETRDAKDILAANLTGSDLGDYLHL